MRIRKKRTFKVGDIVTVANCDGWIDLRTMLGKRGVITFADARNGSAMHCLQTVRFFDPVDPALSQFSIDNSLQLFGSRLQLTASGLLIEDYTAARDSDG